MARFAAGARSAGVGSATLPVMSLYSIGGHSGWIREIGIFNTTTAQVTVALRRLETAGTQGAAITTTQLDIDSATGSILCRNTHTVGPTISAGEIRRATIAPAVGAGLIWTFGDRGFVMEAGVDNGVGILVPDGAGQILDIYFDWEE